MKKIALWHHLTQKYQKLWHQYTHHPFVTALKHDSIPNHVWVAYLEQDQIFLNHLTRLYALLLAKTDHQLLQEILSDTIISSIADEKKHHLQGDKHSKVITATLANRAYTGYLYEVAMRYNDLVLLIALSPCPLGYEVIFNDHYPASVFRKNQTYYQFADFYQQAKYRQMCQNLKSCLDKYNLDTISSDELKTIENVFATVVRLEISFFSSFLASNNSSIPTYD